MDMNEYVMDALVRDRLEEMRLAAQARAIGTRHREPLRAVVGHALVRLGRRLLGDARPVRVPA